MCVNLILNTALGWICYDHPFMYKELGTERLNNLPKFTQLVNGRAEVSRQVVGSARFCF